MMRGETLLIYEYLFHLAFYFIGVCGMEIN